VDETQLGWYGAALRLFGTFVFLPSIVTTALFPAITRLHQQEPGALVPLMRRSAFWLLAVSLPIGLGTAIIADPLVRLLYGPGFMGTVPVLVALSVTLVFTYQNMLVGQYLIAVDRQNTWTIVMLFSTLAKFVLNLIFIPWAARLFGNGAVGAASGLLLAEMAMTVIGFIMLPKGVIGRDAALILPRLLLAGLGMVAVVAPLRHTFILVPLAAGGLTYIGLLWALRVIPKQDWQMMIALAKSFWLRVSRSVPARSQASG
jgi:O-antigen/teichoic acid export membrane protein